MFLMSEVVIRRHSVNRCSLKFCKVRKETTVPESFLKTLVQLIPAALLKKEALEQVFSCETFSSGGCFCDVYDLVNSLFCTKHLAEMLSAAKNL